MPKEIIITETGAVATPKKKGGKANNQTNALKDVKSLRTTEVLSELYLFVKKETFKAYKNGVIIFAKGTNVADVVESTDTFETFVAIAPELRPKYGIEDVVELKYADILSLKHKGAAFGTRTGQAGWWLLTCNGTKHKIARIDGTPVALEDMVAAEEETENDTEETDAE